MKRIYLVQYLYRPSAGTWTCISLDPPLSAAGIDRGDSPDYTVDFEAIMWSDSLVYDIHQELIYERRPPHDL